MNDVTEYRYGMRLRGCSIGTQPNEGLIDREDDDTGEYYDILVYDRPLTEEETSHYSLDFISGGEEEMGKKKNSTTKENTVMENTNVEAMNTEEKEMEVMENNMVVNEEIVEEVVNEVVEETSDIAEEVAEDIVDDTEDVSGAEEDALGIDFNGMKFDLVALDKSNQPYSCAQIAKNIENGKFTFENTVQRTNVWTVEQKSLLVHSLITKMPIPVMYAKSVEGGIKDFLDGKQRANAIYEFYNNEFELTDCPPIHITLTEDEATAHGIDVDVYERDSKERVVVPIDINGYTYEELPVGLQDAFRTAQITIFTYANDDGTELNDDQTADVFFRLNNGTPLTKIEITRVKARCYSLIKQIAVHDIFTEAMTAKSLAKYANEDVVMKGLMLLIQTDEPCLDNKAVRPFIENLEIEETDVSRLSDIFDLIRDAHTVMKQEADKSTDSKERAWALKFAKRIYTRTHLISIIPIVDRAIYEDKNCTEMAGFFKYFFGSKKFTTISKEYNNSTTDGANHTPKVLRRLHAIEEAYEQYFSGKVEITTDDDAELEATA